jgi:hypothetical protein
VIARREKERDESIMVVAEEYMRFQLCVNVARHAVQRSALPDALVCTGCGATHAINKLISACDASFRTFDGLLCASDTSRVAAMYTMS